LRLNGVRKLQHAHTALASWCTRIDSNCKPSIPHWYSAKSFSRTINCSTPKSYIANLIPGQVLESFDRLLLSSHADSLRNHKLPIINKSPTAHLIAGKILESFGRLLLLPHADPRVCEHGAAASHRLAGVVAHVHAGALRLCPQSTAVTTVQAWAGSDNQDHC
jgi:hypothetical protein